MRVRIKFSKHGCQKFIGHLDVMRYFQKAVRRAGFPAVLSSGFSPHMIMSFAQPLSVGTTSDAEYFDLDLKETPLTSEEMKDLLNHEMADGMRVLSVRRIPENKQAKGMSIIAAADYEVRMRDPSVLPDHPETACREFLARDEIRVLKKTKKGEKEIDIRPLIETFEYRTDRQCFLMHIAQGSVHHLKPELLMQTFLAGIGIPFEKSDLLIRRLELYGTMEADGTEKTAPLEEFGVEIV